MNKSLTLVSNSAEYSPVLQSIFDRAKEMYSQKAYVFQYTKYGFDEDSMLDSFYYYQNILDYYNDF